MEYLRVTCHVRWFTFKRQIFDIIIIYFKVFKKMILLPYEEVELLNEREGALRDGALWTSAFQTGTFKVTEAF